MRDAQSPFLQRRHGLHEALPVDSPFNAEWLALRERFDARARSRALAHDFAGMLPDRVTLLELGAGTFSLFRWLAPIVARPQHWICVDNDADLLQRGLELTAAWGRRLGYTVETSEDGARLALHTPNGVWTIKPAQYDLEELDLSALVPDRVSGVMCSALLDLLSDDWLSELVYSLEGVPFYAAMTVTGGIWHNLQDRDDALVLKGFHRNQIGNDTQRDALGPHAMSAVARMAAFLGLNHAWHRSDWTIGPRDRAMLRHVLAFHAGGARNALPQHRARIDTWEARRNRHVDAGRLAMRVAHRDFLISSPEKGPRHAARRRR